MDENQNQGQGDTGGGTPPTDQPTPPTGDQGVQTPPPAGEPSAAPGEKCVTCGNAASGGNCVACGQGEVSCTCQPAPGGGTPPAGGEPQGVPPAV